MKLFTILFVIAIFFCGCSSTYSVRSIAVRGADTYGEMEDGSIYRLNEELNRGHIKIELKDGKEVFAKEVTITDDSVSWLDVRTDKESTASMGQINKIVFVKKNHFLGGLEGLGFGVIGGGGIGWLLGGGAWEKGEEAKIIAYALLVVGIGAGAGIGLITGIIIGHTNSYEFPITEQSDFRTKIRIEKVFTTTDVLYLKNGRIVRGTIIAEVREANNLVRVTIRDVYGEIETYNGWEIERIEKAD